MYRLDENFPFTARISSYADGALDNIHKANVAMYNMRIKTAASEKRKAKYKKLRNRIIKKHPEFLL